jgi:coenzyme PQQ synthesis protein D (PqqD)
VSDARGRAFEDSAARWSPSEEVVAEETGDHMVLIHMRTNRIFELNRTGARVWRLLQEGEDEDGVVRRLLEEFDVQDDELRQEVRQVVRRLAEEELVTKDG